MSTITTLGGVCHLIIYPNVLLTMVILMMVYLVNNFVYVTLAQDM